MTHCRAVRRNNSAFWLGWPVRRWCASEDTVPVVIDDALGFTDPERLTKMGAVFDTVGDHGQVIVLTCTPTRYLGVQDAHVIELTRVRRRQSASASTSSKLSTRQS